LMVFAGGVTPTRDEARRRAERAIAKDRADVAA
jgi:hypothetical protein